MQWLIAETNLVETCAYTTCAHYYKFSPRLLSLLVTRRRSLKAFAIRKVCGKGLSKFFNLVLFTSHLKLA